MLSKLQVIPFFKRFCPFYFWETLFEMKEKIIAAIKAKFPAVNLSKKSLDAIAARIEPKVTEESQIDAQIDAFNDFNPIADIAKTDDTIADLRGKLKKAATPTEKIEPPIEPEATDDTPAYVKTLMEGIKALTAEVSTLKSEKVQDTYASKAKADLKDVNPLIWKGRPIPQEEEAYTAFIAEVKADQAALDQQLTDKGLSHLVAARGGVGGNPGDQKASKEEVSEVLDNIM